MTDLLVSFMSVVLVFSLVAGCGKKESTAVAPAVSTGTQANVAGTSSDKDFENFKPLPIVKKQINYFAEGSPTRAIQDLDDTLDTYITHPNSPEETHYNTTLKKYVLHGTFDVRELCRLSLDKHWAERTTEEQNAFVDLMGRLLEKKAIFSKEQGQKKTKKQNLYQVTYEGDRALPSSEGVKQSLVKSTLHIPSEAMNIELSYKLEQKDGKWVIFDIIVDGASLLDNYRYQFDRIIGKEGYPNLVRRMETKLKDLESKGANNSSDTSDNS